MTATTIFGPDGAPMLTTAAPRRPDTIGGVDVTKIDHEAVDVEVAKRVRHKAVSMASVWDRARGKPKPTPVTFDTLRLMGNRSEWVRAIVKTRKNQIGKVKWSIVPKDNDDTSGATRRMCKAMTKMLSRPSMYGSRPNSRSWRQFIGEVLEDLLILDAGCIEKERDSNGWIVALYPVDGGTIRANINEQGGFYDDAYVQLVDGLVTARFGMEDLVYIMDNPQTDVRFAGYGMSPLEHLVVSVTADLYAAKFNAGYFEKGAVPEGILDLGEDVAPEDVDAFRLYWMNEVMGRPWALPVIGGSKAPQWIKWRDTNRDMQFMEYQQWLLKKFCAVYQITPQEIGILEDVNRSTADSQEGTNQSKSIEPITSLIKDYLDLEVIGDYGQGLGDYIEFEWEEEGDSPEEIDRKYGAMVEKGAASRKEWRDAHGMDDSGHEGHAEYLVDGDPKPLPSKEDVAVMGAAAQQQREDQQTKEGREHEQEMADKQPGDPASTPWQPADGDDPGTKQAMADHDRDTGIGPRNVGKSSPYGRDRHPALTEHEDDLQELFASKRGELVHELAHILNIPDEALEAIA